VDTSRISRIIWKMLLWVKLNTRHDWTCGYADLSSVARPMSQPEQYCNGWRFGYWSSCSPWKVSPRECISYAPSDHLSDAHWPEDIMCQWPLVVCTDVAETIHAPDCWHQSQQSTFPFIQP
jgi:hypothetical protein